MLAAAPVSGTSIGQLSPVAARPVSLVINGRFYSQPLTGVQRYGREITLTLDALVAAEEQSHADLLVPPDTKPVPPLSAIVPKRCGWLTGHAWEQVVLPLRAEHPILNLCNTGPLIAARQIVCVHDANVFDDPDSYRIGFKLLYKTLIPMLGRRAAQVTSVSAFSRQRLSHHLGIDPRLIEVVPNGHEHVFRWRPEASTLSARHAIKRPFVLLLGSRAKHKNAAFILQQAEALDALGLDLLLAGGSAGIFAQSQTIERSNIHWLGVVTDDDLAWLYREALCLAFPSRSEGFGLPLIEAMALGCPVISSNTASMPEVCGAAALLAAPDDAAAWQRHFAALAHSAELRADLAGRGREQVRCFSWQRSAEHYLDLARFLV